MENTKNLFMSKTFWGSALVIVAAGLNLAGIDIGDASGFANDLAALFGASFAIYGRFKAVKKIG